MGKKSRRRPEAALAPKAKPPAAPLRTSYDPSWLFVALLLLLPLSWYVHRLLAPSFGLIDDPYDLEHLELMRYHFARWWNEFGFHGETGDGRLRPMYWLARFFFYYLPAGLNPLGWNVLHYINLAITCVLGFVVTRKLTGSALVSFFAMALWVMSRSAVDNYSRLATQEVWQCLWLAVLLHAVHRLMSRGEIASNTRRALLAGIAVLLFVLYFTKETSVVLFPISLLAFGAACVLKRGVADWGIILMLNLGCFALERYLLPEATGYGAQYHISAQVIIGNLRRYFIELQWGYPLVIAVAAFVLRVGILRRGRGDGQIAWWQSVLLLTGTAFVAIFLPWRAHEERYLMVAEYLFALFVALEIYQSTRRKDGWAVAFISLIVVGFAAAGSGMVDNIKVGERLCGGEEVVSALRWLAAEAKSGSGVLVGDQQSERLRSNVSYLQHFFGRKDLAVYSVSPYAESLQIEGFNVVKGKSVDDGMLQKVRYVVWHRRGACERREDRKNYEVINAMRASRAVRFTILYDQERTVDAMRGDVRGVKIWEVVHAAGAGEE